MTTLLDRMNLVTDNYAEGDVIELLYKIGEEDTIYIANGSIGDMDSYRESYEKDGKISGCDSSGVMINIVDFKLIK